MTIAEKLIEILKDLGSVELDSPSCKYRKFSNPTPQPEARFYWVGPLGALRFGKNVSTSTSRETTRAGSRAVSLPAPPPPKPKEPA